MPPTTSAYDAGAAAYDRLTGRWSRLFVPCLVATAGVASGRSVLDVAADTGEAAPSASWPASAPPASRAASRSGWRVTGVSAGATFDAVVCQFGLMFFPEPRRGLEEFRRVLRPGGRVVHLGLSESGRRAVREEVRGGMAPFRSGDRLVLGAEALIGRGVRGPREDG